MKTGCIPNSIPLLLIVISLFTGFHFVGVILGVMLGAVFMLGGGDIKMLAGIGGLLGSKEVIAIFFLAAPIAILFDLKKRHEFYFPYIAIATLFVIAYRSYS